MGVAKITLPNTTRFAYFNWAVLPGRLFLGIPVSSHTYRSPSLGKTALKRLPKLQFHPQIANEEQISKPTVIEIQSLCRFKANESCVFNVSPIAKPWRGMTTQVVSLILLQSLEQQNLFERDFEIQVRRVLGWKFISESGISRWSLESSEKSALSKEICGRERNPGNNTLSQLPAFE